MFSCCQASALRVSFKRAGERRSEPQFSDLRPPSPTQVKSDLRPVRAFPSSFPWLTGLTDATQPLFCEKEDRRSEKTTSANARVGAYACLDLILNVGALSVAAVLAE